MQMHVQDPEVEVAHCNQLITLTVYHQMKRRRKESGQMRGLIPVERRCKKRRPMLRDK